MAYGQIHGSLAASTTAASTATVIQSAAKLHDVGVSTHNMVSKAYADQIRSSYISSSHTRLIRCLTLIHGF